MRETHPSICRFCSAFCPILADVEGGRVVEVRGDPGNDLYRGYTCPKGRALPEQHNHPDRLLRSRKRAADGSHHDIASDLAMDEVAHRLGEIAGRHGPRAIAMYVGTNSLPYPAAAGLGHALLRGLGSPMFFTSNTIDQPGKQIAAALHGGWKAGVPPFASQDVALLVGVNPLISKASGVPSQNPGRQLKDALDRGMRLIVIDPRRSETARRAHIHLQPRPGEDPTLLAGLIRHVLDRGLEDRAFLAENAAGLEPLRDATAPFTPAYVAARAGVPEALFVEAAECFAGATRGRCQLGTGPSFSPRGNLSEYLALCLDTLCGHWTRAGEPISHPNVLLAPFEARAQPHPPYRPDGYGEKLRVRGLGNATSGMPTAALADEILLPGDGQVRALICVGGNPMMAWPDQRKTHAALQSLDLLVTLDIELSATARLADYVIATRLTLETPGMTQPAEMLKYFAPSIGYDVPYAQYSPAIVEPPPGSDLLEEWEFFYGLAQRLELELAIVNFYGWGRHIESPLAVHPLDMHEKPSTDEIYELLTAEARVPLAEVKKHPHGHVFDEIRVEALPRDPACADRLQLADETMLEELAEVAAEPWERSREGVDLPYRLVSRRANEFLNSSGRSNPRLALGRSYNPLFVHPDDLRRLGVREGDRVRVRGVYDSVSAILAADESMRPGVVSMTHAFGGNPGEDDEPAELGTNTGRLLRTDVGFDPISGMPQMGAIPVAIERV